MKRIENASDGYCERCGRGGLDVYGDGELAYCAVGHVLSNFMVRPPPEGWPVFSAVATSDEPPDTE